MNGFKGMRLPYWLIQTLSDHKSLAPSKRKRRERRFEIELFEPRRLLSVAAPTQFIATAVYNTRVDFTWSESSAASVQGFEVRYELSGSGDDGWTTVRMNPEDPNLTLLPTGDSFGNAVDASNSFATGAAGLRSGAMGGLDSSGESLFGFVNGATYDFEIRATGTDGTSSSWPTDISFAQSVTMSGPSEPTPIIDVTGKYIDVNGDFAQSEFDLNTFNNGSNDAGIYQNIWVERIDESLPASDANRVTMLPVDHADFGSMGGQMGTFTDGAEGSYTLPAFAA